jgi:hypothetical protein
MVSPLEGSLAKTIYGAMKSLFIDATLVRDTPGSGASYDPAAPTQTSYACKAIVDTYSEYTRANGFASESDRKIIILTKSLSVTPVPNDRITVRGVTYAILTVAADPALATWECKGHI